jgi:hypothetical protein
MIPLDHYSLGLWRPFEYPVVARSELEGHSILIVEDEVLVAMDIADAFESVGAVTTMATTLQQALILVESADRSTGLLNIGSFKRDCGQEKNE